MQAEPDFFLLRGNHGDQSHMWKEKKKHQFPCFCVHVWGKFAYFFVFENEKIAMFCVANLDKSLKIMYNLSKGGALCFI